MESLQWGAVAVYPAAMRKLRDDTAEGYNVIPNFFISAKMIYDASGKLSCADNIEQTNNGKKKKPPFYWGFLAVSRPSEFRTCRLSLF